MLLSLLLMVTGLASLQVNDDGKGAAYQLDPAPLPIPYQRYTTKDRFGRTITFYLSRPEGTEKDVKLPVILVIGGSGSQSLFIQSGDRIGGGIQNLVLTEVKKRARVVCVEKPGVSFLYTPKRPGSAMEASEEFRREYTLERWAEANCAALRAVWTMPGIDNTKTLVLGHSEGALTSSFVASVLPAVTHVAPLAGAGPTQLHSLVSLAAEPRPGDKPGDAESRRELVFSEWKKVMADPDSISSFWMGHPHRRWTSFLKYNSTSLLLQSKAKIYLAHGTADTASHIDELDVLRAELAAHGREYVAERLTGLDHGFRKAGAPPGPPTEMQSLFQRILTWFLEGKSSHERTSTANAEGIDLALAARYFEEAQILWNQDAGALWGKPLQGAMLFADVRTRQVVANQPDAEGILQKQGNVYVGTLPASIPIANYARKWAGVHWVIIMWQSVSKDRDVRAVLMMHESWHRIQNDLNLPASNPSLLHLDTLEARYWLQLEWRALQKALLQEGAARGNAIQDALQFRHQRHQLFARQASQEKALEMNEGLAEYSGIKLSGMSEGLQRTYAARKLEEQPAKVGSFLRTFAYLSGPAYGLLIDTKNPGWRKNLQTSADLGSLLENAYDLKVTTLSEAELEQRAERYQGKALKVSEQAREKVRQIEIDQAKARYLDGPVLILPLIKMQNSFTYANLIPLEGTGTVYPTSQITDVWGTLDAKKGALLGSDFKTARVTAPTTTGDSIAGDGWTLVLKPGWSLVPGTRAGDFTLKQISEVERKP